MPVMEIIHRTIERTIEAVEIEPSDPFGLSDPCPKNAGGPHHDIVECHEIACSRCGRIVWQ